MNGVKLLKKLNNEELIKTITQCYSKREILKCFNINITNSTALKYISSFIVENNVNIDHFSNNGLHTTYSYEYVKEKVENNICWTDLMHDMQITFNGNMIKSVKKLVTHYKLSTEHFDKIKAAVKNHSKIKSYDEIFCINSTVQRSTTKNYILKHKLLPYECANENCNIKDVWNDKPITLHLEHKNGINNDNRLENLCFLCPNCHSQTSTYSGRNNNK